MNQEIEALFRTRDEAVRAQNAPLLLSTQIAELDFGSSESYLAAQEMTTQVLHIHEESDDYLVVLVKETYRSKDKPARSAFPVYFLTYARKGLRIYKVR